MLVKRVSKPKVKKSIKVINPPIDREKMLEDALTKGSENAVKWGRGVFIPVRRCSRGDCVIKARGRPVEKEIYDVAGVG